MAKVETVYIHHDELGAESEVPPHTVRGWIAQGWAEGPLPERQKVRDTEAAERAADAQANADRTAAEQEAAQAELVAVHAVPAPPAPPIATRGNASGRETPSGDSTPKTPEEGQS